LWCVLWFVGGGVCWFACGGWLIFWVGFHYYMIKRFLLLVATIVVLEIFLIAISRD